MEKKWNALLLLIVIIIPIIFGVALSSINSFFSWLLIELWLYFTFIFLKKNKDSRQFNSPHNTSFFILAPISIGLFYTIWGYFAFTGFLEENLFSNSYYMSPWTLFFALPYVLYGLYSLNSCFRKFDMIYLYKDKSIKARPFAFIFTLFLFILSIIILISASAYDSIFYFETMHSNIDLLLLLSTIIIGILIFIHALLKKPGMPEISERLIRQRRQRVDRISAPIARNTPNRTRQTTPRTSRPTSQRQRPATQTSSRPRSKPRTATTSKSANRSKKTSQARRTPTSRSSKSASSGKTTITKQRYQSLLPKAGILTLEDFKCIFCFNLPKLPADKARGIILCPKCKHPAHADEFKDWLKSSVLCSRCDSVIPPRDRQNPKVVSVKEYSEVIKEFSRKKR